MLDLKYVYVLHEDNKDEKYNTLQVWMLQIMLMNCQVVMFISISSIKSILNIQIDTYNSRHYPLIILNPFSFFLLQLIDNLVSGRGVITDKASKHNIKSNIYVPRATVMDSGNYTCISQELKTNSTVKVHVLVDGKLLSVFLANKLCQNNPKWLTRIIIYYSNIKLPSIWFLIPNHSKRMFIIRRIIYIIFIPFKKAFNRGLFSICFLRWYKKIIPKAYFLHFLLLFIVMNVSSIAFQPFNCLPNMYLQRNLPLIRYFAKLQIISCKNLFIDKHSLI